MKKSLYAQAFPDIDVLRAAYPNIDSEMFTQFIQFLKNKENQKYFIQWKILTMEDISNCFLNDNVAALEELFDILNTANNSILKFLETHQYFRELTNEQLKSLITALWHPEVREALTENYLTVSDVFTIWNNKQASTFLTAFSDETIRNGWRRSQKNIQKFEFRDRILYTGEKVQTALLPFIKFGYLSWEDVAINNRQWAPTSLYRMAKYQVLLKWNANLSNDYRTEREIIDHADLIDHAYNQAMAVLANQPNEQA